MNNVANNVILFPGTKILTNKKAKSSSRKEIDDNLMSTRQYHVQETLNILVPIIFTQLNIAGFTPADEEDEFSIREGALIVEAIRSHMYSHYGIDHPFQKIVKKIFVPDKDEPDVLTIADYLNIRFKDPTKK